MLAELNTSLTSLYPGGIVNNINKIVLLTETVLCCRFDEGHDGYLDLGELKRMMEKLGAPQTHLGLKAMIKEVDEDGDNKISFREVCQTSYISSNLFQIVRFRICQRAGQTTVGRKTGLDSQKEHRFFFLSPRSDSP
jgi:hypothetical protein